MKQESASITQLVEHKYGFNKCEKTEFVKQMVKEFAKYEKKLAKIENYENMHREGKVLSKEVLELINKKKSFLEHIRQLRNVTDVYVKASDQYTEVVLDAMKERIEVEVERRMREESKKLSDFLVVAEMLHDKDHISPTPLTKVPKEILEAVLAKYTCITRLTHNKNTTMREESEKLQGVFRELFKGDELKSYIQSVMENSSVADAKFEISEGPEYEFVMLQPADRLEMSEQVKSTAVSSTLPGKIEETAPCPGQKEREKRREMAEPLKLEKTVVNESVAPSMVEASQESEFEIAVSRSTKRKINKQRKEEAKEGEENTESEAIQEYSDEEDYERQFLNHCKMFRRK
eukprot:TRINITY_DN2038_c0_g1_i3.p1 TRINITY_DN2038_c0_g1~~TRINITY_DN2038_c0_g1_i3.p1  ORF type:complete len:347 (-),score=148.78 TRINITY_DN2038_c0_g1_i3:188-1228(-)